MRKDGRTRIRNKLEREEKKTENEGREKVAVHFQLLC